MTSAVTPANRRYLSRIEQHAELTGKTYKSCLDEALKDYIEVKIPPREAGLFHRETKQD